MHLVCSGVFHSLSQVLHHHEDPRLREQEWGNYQDPAKIDEIKQQRRETGAFYFRFPTGERYFAIQHENCGMVMCCVHSGADVFDRVSMFLETLYRDMEKGTCGQNTIIVTHGLFCRLFLTRYYHWTVCGLPHSLYPTYINPCAFCRWRSSTSYGTLSIASTPSWSCSHRATTNLCQISRPILNISVYRHISFVQFCN